MIPTLAAPHTPVAYGGKPSCSAGSPLSPPRKRGTRGPLWGLGAGSLSVALAGWGSSGMITNQQSLILYQVAVIETSCHAEGNEA
ncbi:hypothetical protein NIES4073_21570 [Kalymmatonema gypsitolerans NIES-4073]|nr:hypothetical protein NIES4073_21570 [Scytonema sp. NIES-4073]